MLHKGGDFLFNYNNLRANWWHNSHFLAFFKQISALCHHFCVICHQLFETLWNRL